MGQKADEFAINYIHDLEANSGIRTLATSEGMGWNDLYAAYRSIKSTKIHFTPINSHLVIINLGASLTVDRSSTKKSGRKTVPMGGMMIVPSDMESYDCIEGDSNVLFLYIKNEVFYDVLYNFSINQSLENFILPKMGIVDSLIEQLCLNILYTITHKDINYSNYSKNLSKILARNIILKHSNFFCCELNQKIFFRSIIERSLDYMQENLSHPINLDEISSAVGLNTSNFARRFRAATGTTPHRKLLLMRIDRAKRMLIEQKSIEEVADACGFCGGSHLINQFHRFMGQTPAAFRRAAAN